MPPPYKPYIPKNIDDIRDYLGAMMLDSPKFLDKTGYFPGKNLEVTFFDLNESLRLLRKQLTDEQYVKLMDMSDRMRAHFEADPEDRTDDALKGRDIIVEMRDLLKQSGGRS